MATATSPFSVIFPQDFHSRLEFETPSKGYLGGVQVQLENGNRYSLFFYDPVRLDQDLKAERENGRDYLAEPNLVVVPEVTTEAIRKAVAGLHKDGYFKHLKPL